jgi:hypothetical protein
MPRHFQFTVSDLLWATFWVAVSCGAWTFLARNDGSDRLLPSATVALFLGTASPAVALSILLRKALFKPPSSSSQRANAIAALALMGICALLAVLFAGFFAYFGKPH